MSLIELLDEKNILEAVVDKIGDAVSIQDLNFKVVYQNQAHQDIIGNHLGAFCFNAYEHRESICEGCPLALALSDGGVHSAVRSTVTPKGTIFVEITASALRNASGEIVGGIEIARDITERKRKEEQLHLYQEIIAHMAEGVCLIRASDGVIVYTNEKFDKTFGYEAGELLKRHISVLNAPAGNKPEETAREIMHALKETGAWSGEIQNIKKDGVCFWCFAMVSSFEHHVHGTVWIAIHQDISGRKQAEKELLASKKMLEDITHGITESILLLSKDLKIVWANNTALQQTGLVPDGLIGNYCYKATHLRESPCEPPNEPCPVSELLKNAVPVTMEHIHYDRNGKKVFVEVSAYPVHDSTGEISNLVHISKDITERKELEEGLREKTARLLQQSHELQEINAELNTLYEISRAISQTIDLDKLLYEILARITAISIFRLERKGILFLVEDRKMRIASTIGFSGSYFLEIHKNMMVGDCLCGLAAATGAMITSNNSEHDPRHTINDAQAGSHGHIIVPLKVADTVVGVLCLYLPPDITLEARELNLLLSVGSQIGIVIENARIFKETKSLALHDPLTGLANRRCLQVQLERNFAVTRRYGKSLSVIMLDIDHFKEYNDRYGHLQGDLLLVQVAEVLARNRRGADGAFRYGGEEFLVMLPETDLPQAAVIAERLRHEVAAELEVTVSLGVSSYQDAMHDQNQLVDAADRALYRAKNNGRNRVESDS